MSLGCVAGPMANVGVFLDDNGDATDDQAFSSDRLDSCPYGDVEVEIVAGVLNEHTVTLLGRCD